MTSQRASRASVCYRLTLVPLPGGLPPSVRIRGALKVLLRSFRLRCASLEELADSVRPGGESCRCGAKVETGGGEG